MKITTWAVLAFLALVWIQRLLETFARREKVAGELKMRWSLHALFVLHAIVFIGSAVELLALQRPLTLWVSAVGIALYICSLVVRNMAIRALGRFWSLQVEIRKEHQLVREGIYNHLRHPAYAAIVLEVLSVPMVANAWFTMLFAALAYIPMLILRLKKEEVALVEKFGDDYRNYQGEVGALIPRWGNRTGPARP